MSQSMNCFFEEFPNMVSVTENRSTHLFYSHFSNFGMLYFPRRKFKLTSRKFLQLNWNHSHTTKLTFPSIYLLSSFYPYLCCPKWTFLLINIYMWVDFCTFQQMSPISITAAKCGIPISPCPKKKKENEGIIQKQKKEEEYGFIFLLITTQLNRFFCIFQLTCFHHSKLKQILHC